MPAYVALRHVRFDDAGLLAKTIAEIVETGSTTASGSTGSTASRSTPGEYYLTLARWTDDARTAPTSDYAGQQVYYRSIQQRETDLLTIYDYLWRWDTDWFWCSGAFGAQHPRGPPALAAALAALRRLPCGCSGWTAASGSPTGSTAAPGGRCASG